MYEDTVIPVQEVKPYHSIQNGNTIKTNSWFFLHIVTTILVSRSFGLQWNPVGANINSNATLGNQTKTARPNYRQTPQTEAALIQLIAYGCN